jgi:hypothetical protein
MKHLEDCRSAREAVAITTLFSHVRHCLSPNSNWLGVESPSFPTRRSLSSNICRVSEPASYRTIPCNAKLLSWLSGALRVTEMSYPQGVKSRFGTRQLFPWFGRIIRGFELRCWASISVSQ